MQTVNLPIAIDESLSIPLYEQISRSLKDAIKSGQLPDGSIIDSTRELSRKLGVSRHTVMHSIELLQSQGFIESRNGRLVTISRGNLDESLRDQVRTSSKEISLPISELGEKLLTIDDAQIMQSSSDYFQPFDLPVKRWRRLAQHHVSNSFHLLCSREQDPFGFLPLREQLADYLSRARSISCSSRQIVVFHDSASALDLLLRFTLDAGDSIAVENPLHPSISSQLRSYDFQLIPLNADDEGAEVSVLDECERHPRAIFVTPSHNNPKGVPMSLGRRNSLLSWVDENDTFVIENDEDSLYRYTTRPFPSLHALDPTGARVIYLSSFSKAISPLIDLAFVVLPESLVATFESGLSHLQQSSPMLDQLILADLLHDGYLERHIRKSTQSLGHRRRALIIALTREFQRNVRISQESFGTHLLVNLNTPNTLDDVLSAAMKAGLQVASTRSHYLNGSGRDGELLMSFADLEDESIDSKVRCFAAELMDSRLNFAPS